MRTSLSEIKLIEKYLLNELDDEDKFSVEILLLTNPDFREKVRLQRKIYELLEDYFLEEIRFKSERYYFNLFADPSKFDYHRKIAALFN